MAKRYNMDKITPSAISDLFGENKDLETIDKTETKSDIRELDIEKIYPYPNHYFHKPKGEEWESFVESIRQQGILQPIIVREHPQKNGCFQIIAGHCRTEGAKEAELMTVPAIILNEIDDVDASVLVGLTNRQREHISDIEWGKTYRETYELMKRQGKRMDLTSCHDGTNLKGLRSDELLAQKYGESSRTIQRKIRLSYLIPNLAAQYEDKKFKQSVAVDLSYLKETEQEHISTYIFCEKVSITDEMAKELKRLSKAADESGKELDVNDIGKVLLKSNSKEKVIKDKKAQYKIPDTYFPEKLKKQEKEEYVLKALLYIKEKNIAL